MILSGESVKDCAEGVPLHAPSHYLQKVVQCHLLEKFVSPFLISWSFSLLPIHLHQKTQRADSHINRELSRAPV